MAERRAVPQDLPPQRQSNGNGWKSLSIALISLVGTVFVLVTTFTKGTATIEQVREERAISKEERAQSKSEADGIWKGLQALEERVTALTRDQDRRGGRVDRLEEAHQRVEGRLAALEAALGTLMQLRAQLEALKDSVNRVDNQLRDLNERLQRRPEPLPESPRGRPLPRGFP